MKTYNLESFGEEIEVAAVFARYGDNNRLALQLFEIEDGCIAEPYATVTVNLEDELTDEGTCAFIDTNDNPDILEWLEENEFGSLTGYMSRSGYCTYPEFKFKDDIIAENEAGGDSE